MNETTNKSGDNTELRELKMKLHEFHSELYGKYPQYLRNMIRENPFEFDIEGIQKKKKKNRFELSLLSSLYSGAQPGFSPDREYNERKSEHHEAYMKVLDSKRKHSPTENQTNIMDDDKKTDDGEDEEVIQDYMKFKPKPVCDTTFWKIMKKKKKKIHSKYKSSPVPYPRHRTCLREMES